MAVPFRPPKITKMTKKVAIRSSASVSKAQKNSKKIKNGPKTH
jgi:hypothetical protein